MQGMRHGGGRDEEAGAGPAGPGGRSRAKPDRAGPSSGEGGRARGPGRVSREGGDGRACARCSMMMRSSPASVPASAARSADLLCARVPSPTMFPFADKAEMTQRLQDMLRATRARDGKVEIKYNYAMNIGEVFHLSHLSHPNPQSWPTCPCSQGLTTLVSILAYPPPRERACSLKGHPRPRPEGWSRADRNHVQRRPVHVRPRGHGPWRGVGRGGHSQGPRAAAAGGAAKREQQPQQPRR